MTMKLLFSCLFGSRLYGTQTPTSDLDVKHVYLPDLDDMLIGKKLVNSVKNTNTKKNTRNNADDVDEEFIPVQIFARDFLNGQTYAMELAFAVDGTHAEQTHYPMHNVTVGFGGVAYGGNKTPFMLFVYELREKFLTSNIKALMGYAVHQASLYSFKGERLTVVREVKKLLTSTAQSYVDHRLGDCLLEDKWFSKNITDLMVKYPKYFKQEEYDVGGGQMKPCFKLLEKTLPFSDRAYHARDVVDALEKRYGNRADAASVDNVDWKATMHALRVVDEGLRLLEHGTLSFPFSPTYVEHLLNVKQGRVDLALVKEELDSKLERLKMLEQTTVLRPLTQELTAEFDEWLARWMRRFYNV